MTLAIAPEDVVVQQFLAPNATTPHWILSIDGQEILKMRSFEEAIDLASSWLSTAHGRMYRQEIGGALELVDSVERRALTNRRKSEVAHALPATFSNRRVSLSNDRRNTI